jgi:hypothetical protein
MLSKETKVTLSGVRVNSLGSFGSYPGCEGDTASLTGSLTGSLLPREEEPTASPTDQFKVGSRVAVIDPEKKSYNWHGTIVRIGKSKYADVYGADVSWDERKGMMGGPILFHRLEELRLI